MPASKHSDELVQKILEMLLDGMWINEACRKVGITDRTLRRWRQDDDKLRAQVDDAQKMGYMKQLETAFSKLRKAKGRDQILRADKEIVHLEWIISKMVPGFEDKRKVTAEIKTVQVQWSDDGDEDARALDPSADLLSPGSDTDLVH